MAPKRTCRGTRADGEPCRAPSRLVDPSTGYCPAHGPGASERMAEAGRKGAEVAARKRRGKGLDPETLPPVATAEDPYLAAMEAIEIVVRAVGDGTLGHTKGRVMISGFESIVELHEKGAVADRLEELTDALAEWRKTGDPAPVLELVDGGGS